MSEDNKFRFRGGVRRLPDTGKWHIIIEINGTQYLDETEFDTEGEAMVVYREAREAIAKDLMKPAGPDLDILNPIWCSHCDVRFDDFKIYDAHLPCAKMPPGGDVELG